MISVNNLNKAESMVKNLFDGITVTNVFGYLSGMFTMPNLITFFTFIWAFSRFLESVTGLTLHEWIKKYCVYCKKFFK